MTGPRLFRLAVALLATLAGQALALAQTWPDRPVKVIVANPAGGSADRFGRLVAGMFANEYSARFIVENIAGASGAIAAAQVARAAPDGYTLMVGASGPHVSVPLLSEVKYDPVGDFSHLAMIGGDAYILAAHPKLGIRTLAGLLALARGAKEPLQCAIPSANSLGSIVLEHFARVAGFELVHVPYRGGGMATTDLLGNQVSLAILPVANLGPMIRAGMVVPLAISGRDRSRAFPEVPTFLENGFPDVVAESWFWLAAPRDLPASLADRLHASTIRALDSPEIRRQFEAEASIRRDLPRAAMAGFVAGELAHWRALMKNAGLKPLDPPSRAP